MFVQLSQSKPNDLFLTFFWLESKPGPVQFLLQEYIDETCLQGFLIENGEWLIISAAKSMWGGWRRKLCPSGRAGALVQRLNLPA